MKPLISIVIPTYNRARDLERALRSVLAQTYPHWEALIVDNHSSDTTDELLKDFNDSRIKLFKVQNVGVIAASRNLGIKHARGEYIAFLDSDDWWTPQKLETSLHYLGQGADVIYHDLFTVTKTNQRLFWKKASTRDLASPVFEDLIINGNALNNSSVVASRKLLNEINGFSEECALVAAEDYDGWLRAARVTEKFTRIPQTLGYYWSGGENISSPGRTLKTLEAFEKLYANEIIDLSVRRSIYWLRYAKGRAYYRLGFYELAKKNLAPICWQRAPFFLKMKSGCMLLLMRLRHRNS